MLQVGGIESKHCGVWGTQWPTCSLFDFMARNW